MTGIDVALAALRTDAGTWRDVATRLDGPRTTVAGLGLTAGEFSPASDLTDIDRTYEEVRAAFARLLTQAAAGADAIAAALSAAADTYEHEDRSNAATMNGIIR